MSNTTPAPKPSKVKLTGWPKWRRRLLRTLIVLVVAAILFRMLLTLLLPTAIERAAAFYGMHCEYGRSKLGLMGGYAALWDVRLTPAEGGQQILRAGFCEASISTWALLHGRLQVWRVGADDVDVNIYRDAHGEIPLLQKLIAPPAKEGAPVQVTPRTTALDLSAPFQVDAFRLNRVALSIKDDSVTPPFVKTINIDVRVSDVGLTDKPARFDLFVQSDDLIEELRLSGDARLSGRVIDAQMHMSGRGIQPKAVPGYLSALGIQPTGSEVNFTGRASLKTEGVEQTLSAFKGAAELRELRVYDEHNDDIVRVGRISVTPTYVSTDRIDLGRVEIADVNTLVQRTPEAYVAFAGLAMHAAEAATTQPATLAATPATPATQPAAAPLPKLSLAAFDVRNMRFVLNDTAIAGGANLALVVNHLDLEHIATYATTQPAPITLSADLSAPKLASRITLKGDAYPFESDKRGNLQFTIEGIRPDAIKPYLDAMGIESTYQSGRLNCEASGLFRKTATGDLQGNIILRDLSLTDEQTLLKLADGRITNCTINPQTLDTHIGAIDISGPTLTVRRDSDGQVHVLGLKTMKVAPQPVATEKQATEPAAALQRRSPTTQRARATLPRFQLDRFTWKDVQVDYSDESAKPSTHYSMTNAGIELDHFVLDTRPTTRPAGPASFTAWASMPGLVESAKATGELILQPGKAQFSSRADAQGINTKALAPYFPWDFQPTVEHGAFSAQAGATFTTDGNAARVDADISNVIFSNNGKSLLQLGELKIINAQPLEARILVDSIRVVQPALSLATNADGSKDYPGFHGITTQRPAPLWDMFKQLPAPPDIQCKQLVVDKAKLTYEDRSFAPAAILTIQADVTLDNLQIGEISAPGKLAVRGAIEGAIESFGLDATLNAGKQGYSADTRVWARGIHSGPLDAYLAPSSISTKDGRAFASVSAMLTNHEGGGLAGRIDVKDLLVQEGETPRLAIEHITLDSSEMSQPRERATIDELSIVGIRANVQRLPDGTFDVIAVRNAPGPIVYKAVGTATTQRALEVKNAAEIIAEARKTLPLISVGKFLVSGNEITFTDLARPAAAPIVIEDLQLHNANPLLWFGPKPANQPANRYELSMKVSPIVDDLAVDLDIAPFAANPEAQLRVNATGIRGEGIAKVLPELTSMVDFSTLNDGQATMKLDTSLKVERRGAADFDFARGFVVDADISGLQLTNTGDKRPLLGIQDIKVNSARVEPRKHLVTIPSLDITKPVASVYRTPAGLRAAGVTVKLPTATTAPSSAPQAQNATSANSPVTAVPGLAQDTTATSAPFDFQVRKVTISGLDVLYADTAFSPEVVVPLTSLDADISDVGTLSLKQPKPIRFNMLLGSGKILLPKTDKAPAGEHDLFSLATANGSISLYPQPNGWAKAAINGLEMAAFEGAAKSQKVNIANGLFDGELDLRITGARSADVRAKGVLTDLSVSEDPGGPIESKLKLQVPLDAALKLIEDADGSITVPINFAITNGAITWDQLYASAASAAVQTITTAIASSPLKLISGIAGGGGAEQPKDAPKATLEFAPGDATLSARDVQDLQAMIKHLNDDKNAQLTIRHRLSESDESMAEARANPDRTNARNLVAGLRLRKQELLSEREILLAQTSVAVVSKPRSASSADLDRLHELNRDIHETDASLEKALDLFRPGADRQVARRTRGACVTLGQARLDAVKAYLMASKVKDIDKRMEVAPASGEITPDTPNGSVLVTLVTRKR